MNRKEEVIKKIKKYIERNIFHCKGEIQSHIHTYIYIPQEKTKWKTINLHNLKWCKLVTLGKRTMVYCDSSSQVEEKRYF